MSKTVNFTAIESGGASAEEVAGRLREMIYRGELRSGDRLPPERDLTKLLGISRPTLRAGIRSLTAVGILQSKQGAGTFVVAADESPTLDGNPLRLLASLHGFTDAEIFETRVSLETALAALAAHRADAGQLKALTDQLAEMFAALDRAEEYAIRERRFHQLIGAAAGNRILTALMNMVTTILAGKQSESIGLVRDLRESAEMHRRIYDAVRARDAEAASDAMRDCLLLGQKTSEIEMIDAPGK